MVFWRFYDVIMSCWVPLYWVPSYCGHQWPWYIWLVNIKIRIKWTKHDYSQVKHEWPRNDISTIHLELLFGSQHPSSTINRTVIKSVTWVTITWITWLETSFLLFLRQILSECSFRCMNMNEHDFSEMYHTLEKYNVGKRQIQEFETWKTIYGVLKIPSLQILTPQIDWQSRFHLIMVK